MSPRQTLYSIYPLDTAPSDFQRFHWNNGYRSALLPMKVKRSVTVVAVILSLTSIFCFTSVQANLTRAVPITRGMKVDHRHVYVHPSDLAGGRANAIVLVDILVDVAADVTLDAIVDYLAYATAGAGTGVLIDIVVEHIVENVTAPPSSPPVTEILPASDTEEDEDTWDDDSDDWDNVINVMEDAYVQVVEVEDGITAEAVIGPIQDMPAPNPNPNPNPDVSDDPDSGSGSTN
jgi:hypothetical protein